MKKNNKIVWVVNKLSNVGGGEKLLLEGVRYYESIGYEVTIVTWEFDEKALFDGKYTISNLINLKERIRSRNEVFKRALDRLRSLPKLRNILKEIQPEYIFTQGEYDVAVVYIASLGLQLKYVFLIFGQMFQYPHDYSKYSLIFRRHLQDIRNSQQGYLDTIPAKMPKTSLANRFANEIASLIRYRAVRNAHSRFVFSKSTQWETRLLFKSSSSILKGAFTDDIFEEKYDHLKVKEHYNIPNDKIFLLSFSRLDYKKRIDIMIKAMKYLPAEYILGIAGYGGWEKQLKKIAADENVSERVYFLGYIAESEANSLKFSSDILLSMDIGDFDISPFEGLALGTKAVLPTEFDMDEDLCRFENIIVTTASEKELALAIKELAKREKQEHKKIMQKYTWSNYFQSILNLSQGA